MWLCLLFHSSSWFLELPVCALIHTQNTMSWTLVVKLDFLTENNLQQSCGLKGKPIHTIWLWEYCEAFTVVDSENRVEVSMSLWSQLGAESWPLVLQCGLQVTVHLWEQELQRVFPSYSSVSPTTLIWKEITSIILFTLFHGGVPRPSVYHNWHEDTSLYQKRFLYFVCIYLLLIKCNSTSLM